MEEWIIETENLTKAFGDFVAVNKLNLKVKKGEIFGFLGPNGSGKSTTIRMLCGIMNPTSGTGKVMGYDIMKEPEKIKLSIGYMTQKFSLYEDMTAEENLEFFGRVYGLDFKQRKKRKDEIIELLGMEKKAKDLSGSYSGGWKQRLALGCALIHNPPLLFLDEPTGGVDPVSRRQFWEILYYLADMGVTSMVSTHYMDEAERCHALGFIHTSNLIAYGTPQELVSNGIEGKILEIECKPLMKALTTLQKLDGVKSVSMHRDGLHAVVEDVDKIKELILKTFAKLDIQIDECEEVKPSLEDIFVSLTNSKQE